MTSFAQQNVEKAMHWIIVFFDSELALAGVEHDPGDEFWVDGVHYVDALGSDFVAFYDRLESGSGRLVGIRIWPLEPAEPLLLNRSAMPAYVRLPEGLDCIDLFLSPDPWDGHTTGDQAFGGRVYKSDSGRLAVSIDLAYLAQSPDDVEAVRTAQVRWTDVRST